MKKSKKTYQTKEEAQKAASYNKGYIAYEVKNGWRIRKRSPNKKKARKNSGQFLRSQDEVDQAVEVFKQVHNLIGDYLRLKKMMDSVKDKIAKLLR